MRKNAMRIILIMLALVLVLGLVSCKKDKEPEDTEDATTTETPASEISFLDYALVRPDNAGKMLTDEISNLYAKLSSATEEEVVFTTDYLDDGADPDSEAKEILVGLTNRPESKEAYDELSGNEYVIAVKGNKIVIVGTTDSVTIGGIKYFMSTYLKGDSAGKMASDTYIKQEADVATIIENGKANYTLVCPEDSGVMNEDMGNRFFEAVKTATGVELPRSNDAAAYDANSYQILLGYTSYKETASVKSTTSQEGYTIDYIGNKIVIFGWTGEAMQKAVEEFSTIVNGFTNKNEDGATELRILKERMSADSVGSKYFKSVPLKLEGRNVDSVYDSGDNAMMLYWANAGINSFSLYTGSLEKQGFSKYQSFENDSISSATYTRDKASVHVYYLKRVDELRVTTQENAVLPVNPYRYEKLCNVAVTQLGLDYSGEGDLAGGGMGYLVRLEDGTFVVIDGGHPTTADVDNLYNLMLAQKPAGIENVVISAWIITHGHSDHFGVYNDMATKYGDRVTVKMLVGNDPAEYTHSTSTNPDHVFPHAEMISKFKDCVYLRVHTGEQLFFPGITINTLYTHEDVYPNYMSSLNDMGTIVFDLTVNVTDTKYLFLADACGPACDRMVAMYDSDLKCDIVQIGHHGNQKGGLKLYQLCDPDIALWPAAGYQSSGYANQEQNKWLLENVDTVIYAHEGNYTFNYENSLVIDNSMTGSVDKDGDYTRFY